MVRHLALGLLATSLVLGCTGTQTNQDAGVARLKSCTSNAECGGLACDLARLQCVCTQDAMCTDSNNPFCNVFTGRCEPTLPMGSCTADSCPADYYCDQGSRKCNPKLGFCAQCTNNDQCGSGNYCIVHPDYPDTPKYCAAACGANDVCAAGSVCKQTTVGVKQCVPEGEVCGGSPRCIADSLAACNGDGSCNDIGQHCDGTLMRCVANDDGCAFDQVCDPRTLRCAQPCGVSNPATGNQECRARFGGDADAGMSTMADFVCINHVCRPSTQCTSDDQCALNQFCAHNPTDGSGALGNCEPACTTDQECPLGQRCIVDSTSGRLGCQNSCQSNADCPLTAICRNGQCASRDEAHSRNYCQTKQVCAFRQACEYNADSDGTVCITKTNYCSRGNPVCANGTVGKVIGWHACGGCPVGSTAACRLGSTGCDADDPNLGCSGSAYVCTATRCLGLCQTTDDCPKGLDCVDLVGNKVCAPNQDGELCFSPPS